MSNITEYVSSLRAKFKGPKADIIERWNTRVVPQGLHSAGRSGAGDYLARYGKGISAKKVVALALMAEHSGSQEMADGLWEKAYQLETGESESFSSSGSPATSAPINVPTARRVEEVEMAGLPCELQPGMVATMQPVDAELPQSHYILSPDYIGQPKRDGHRNVVFARFDTVAHQSRSTLVAATFASIFDEAAKSAADKIGPFVVDGEKMFLSVTGSEHRTAAQAATVNVAEGQGTVAPVTKYSIFKALFYKGRSLMGASEIERVKAGFEIAVAICSFPLGDVIVEATPTAYTTGEKQALADKQKAEGREGEVWSVGRCVYSGGKGHVTDSVRTKYLTKLKAVITGFTESKSDGRSIAAFLVSDLNGNPLGKVGTGFDAATAADLVARHTSNPGSVIVDVVTQGFTETGKLHHGRFGK